MNEPTEPTGTIEMDVELPVDLAAQIEDNRRHPERRRPRPVR